MSYKLLSHKPTYRKEPSKRFKDNENSINIDETKQKTSPHSNNNSDTHPLSRSRSYSSSSSDASISRAPAPEHNSSSSSASPPTKIKPVPSQQLSTIQKLNSKVASPRSQTSKANITSTNSKLPLSHPVKFLSLPNMLKTPKRRKSTISINSVSEINSSSSEDESVHSKSRVKPVHRSQEKPTSPRTGRASNSPVSPRFSRRADKLARLKASMGVGSCDSSDDESDQEQYKDDGINREQDEQGEDEMKSLTSLHLNDRQSPPISPKPIPTPPSSNSISNSSSKKNKERANRVRGDSYVTGGKYTAEDKDLERTQKSKKNAKNFDFSSRKKDVETDSDTTSPDTSDSSPSPKRIAKLESQILKHQSQPNKFKNPQNLPTTPMSSASPPPIPIPSFLSKSTNSTYTAAANLHNETLKTLDLSVQTKRSLQHSLGLQIRSQTEALNADNASNYKLDIEIWNIEKEYLVDQYILRKMELEKVRKNREEMDELVLMTFQGLEALNDERAERREREENKMERLLKRIPHLCEAVWEQDGVVGKTVDGMKSLVNGESDGTEVFRLGAEVNKVRLEMYEEKVKALRNERKELELERDGEVKRWEREVKMKKKNWDQLVRSGGSEGINVEYVTKIEMGEVSNPLIVVEEIGNEELERLSDTVVNDEDDNNNWGSDLFPKQGGGSDDEGEEEEEEEAMRVVDIEDTDAETKIDIPPLPPLTEINYKQALTDFFTKYDPKKANISNLDLAIKNSKGKEEELFAVLQKKHNHKGPPWLDKYASDLQPQNDDIVKERARISAMIKARDETKSNKILQRKATLKALKEKQASSSNLPKTLLCLTKAVKTSMPATVHTLETLNSELLSLETEMTWLTSIQPSAWSKSAKRLSKLDTEKYANLKAAYIIELKEYDGVVNLKALARDRLSHERDIHLAVLDIQNEVISEAIRGVWNEVNRLVTFSKRSVGDSIFRALANDIDRPGGVGKWRPSLWFGCIEQMTGDREVENLKVYGERIVRSSQMFEEHWTNRKDALSGEEKKKEKEKEVVEERKVESLTVVSVSQIDSIPVMKNMFDGNGRDSPARIDAFQKLEQQYWHASINLKTLNISLPKNVGGVTEVQFGEVNSSSMNSSTSMLAVGTTQGALLVYSLSSDQDQDQTPENEHQFQLIRLMNELPKAERSPVESLTFTLDATTSLLTLDANKVVRLWSLEVDSKPNVKNGHTRDAFPTSAVGFTPGIPSLGLTLSSADFARPAYYDPVIKARVEGEDLAARKKKGNILGFGTAPAADLQALRKFYNIQATVNDLVPTIAHFHPAMTMLGHQPSIMIACRDGSMLKWNNISEVAGVGETTVSGKSIVYGKPIPVVEMADPRQKDADKNVIFKIPQGKGAAPQREFYEYHKTEVAFIGFVGFAELRMVSVDFGGFVGVWEYDERYFTGNCWFVPSRKCKLDLSYKDVAAKILKIAQSSSGLELFLLCQYEDTLLKVWCLHIESLTFLPYVIKHELKARRKGAGDVASSSTFAVMPTVKATGSDYIMLLVNGEVLVYSVASGSLISSFGGNGQIRPLNIEQERREKILDLRVSCNGRFVVYETPGLKSIVVSVVGGNGGGEAIRKELSKNKLGRHWHNASGMGKACYEAPANGHNTGEGMMDEVRNVILECLTAAFSEIKSKNDKMNGVSEGVKKKVESGNDERRGIDRLEITFLGEGKLGTVNPVTLLEV